MATQTWKVNGVIELSITSVMQKASIRTISSLPYMELSATQRWVLTIQKSKLRNYIHEIQRGKKQQFTVTSFSSLEL